MSSMGLDEGNMGDDVSELPFPGAYPRPPNGCDVRVLGSLPRSYATGKERTFSVENSEGARLVSLSFNGDSDRYNGAVGMGYEVELFGDEPSGFGEESDPGILWLSGRLGRLDQPAELAGTPFYAMFRDGCHDAGNGRGYLGSVKVTEGELGLLGGSEYVYCRLTLRPRMFEDPEPETKIENGVGSQTI